MTRDTPWTPYANEETRHQILRRRRIIAGLLLVLLGGANAAALLLFTDASTTIGAGGNTGTTVSLGTPDEDEERTPDATVAVRPGRTYVMDRPVEQPEPPQDDTTTTQRGGVRPEPIHYGALAAQWAPALLALAGAALLLGGGRRKSIHEVNFGVYKGAMPLELISHRYRKLIHTDRLTTENPFGKSRSDYLPREWEHWEAPHPPGDDA